MWKQLEFEFTWKDMTIEEIKRVPFIRNIEWGLNKEHFLVINLVKGKIAHVGDLFTCKRFMIEAPKFYSEHPYYSNWIREAMIFYQLVGFPELLF